MKKPPFPAVFLDRDGTLIHDRPGHYLSDPAKLRLYKNTIPALRLLRKLGFRLFIVTNQSGIARGYFTRATAEKVNARLEKLLAAGGARIDETAYCPHGPNDGCLCRKPLPLMGRKLIKKHNIAAERSFMVGDKKSDMEFGGKLGLKTILLRTGHGQTQLRKPQALSATGHVSAGILQAARFIKHEIQNSHNTDSNGGAASRR